MQMAVEIVKKQSQKTSNHDDLLQPVVYGVLPEQSNDEISLLDLFSKLASQWKLIAAVTVGGTLLSAAFALVFYQPSNSSPP